MLTRHLLHHEQLVSSLHWKPRENRACGDSCGCTDCSNPLNGLDVENLSICTIQHAELLRSLTEAQLAKPMEMPCEHCEKASPFEFGPAPPFGADSREAVTIDSLG